MNPAYASEARLSRNPLASSAEILPSDGSQGFGERRKATQVLVPEKINTQVTRTKQHYPAYSGTTACQGHASPVINKIGVS
jgi:hypothetical protein